MLWPEPYDPAFTQMFLNGRAAFYAGGLHYILQRLPGSLTNWGGAFLTPEPGLVHDVGLDQRRHSGRRPAPRRRVISSAS